MFEKNNYSFSFLIFLYALVFYFIFILSWREPLEKNVKIITESTCSCLIPDLKKNSALTHCRRPVLSPARRATASQITRRPSPD